MCAAGIDFGMDRDFRKNKDHKDGHKLLLV